MKNDRKHKIALKVACRVMGIADIGEVCGRDMSPTTRAARALFIAMCRHHGHHAAPATLAQISVCLGRTPTAASHLHRMLTGEPGIALTRLAERWHAALDGERVKGDSKLAMAATLEVAPEVAAECGVGVTNGKPIGGGA